METRTIKAQKTVRGKTYTKMFSIADLDMLGRKKNGTYDGWELVNENDKATNSEGVKPKKPVEKPEPIDEIPDTEDVEGVTDSDEELADTEEEKPKKGKGKK